LNGFDDLGRTGDAVTGEILSKDCQSLLEVFEYVRLNLHHEMQEYSIRGTDHEHHRFSTVSKGDHDR